VKRIHRACSLYGKVSGSLSRTRLPPFIEALPEWTSLSPRRHCHSRTTGSAGPGGLPWFQFARLGSFRRAAEEMFVTQAAVTSRIKLLEEWLGFDVFQRHRRGSDLTAQGERFIDYARNAIDIIEHGREEAMRATSYRAHYRFMSQYLLLEGFAFDWIDWMQEHAADVSISIDSSPSTVAARDISSGLLDLAVGYQYQNARGVVFETLFNERLILVTSYPNARAFHRLREGADTARAGQRLRGGAFGAAIDRPGPVASGRRGNGIRTAGARDLSAEPVASRHPANCAARVARGKRRIETIISATVCLLSAGMVVFYQLASKRHHVHLVGAIREADLARVVEQLRER
jgi:DNA-binding transcriptional LysR family regulator